MMPINRLVPTASVGLTPLLFCNEANVSSDGAALACPQCAGPNLHLDAVHFAVPTEDHYTPTAALSITPNTGAIHAGDEARHLHAGTNPGRCSPSATGASSAAKAVSSYASTRETCSPACTSALVRPLSSYGTDLASLKCPPLTE